MSESVVFVYSEFAGMFPELNTSEEQAELAFEMAEGIVNNTPSSVVQEVCRRKKILYLLTAHIAFLLKRGAGSIGAVSNASEGSVSVGYAGLGQLGQSYFGQSQYGLLFWQLTAKYRSGFYVA
jgi:hypothetical protein